MLAPSGRTGLARDEVCRDAAWTQPLSPPLTLCPLRSHSRIRVRGIAVFQDLPPIWVPNMISLVDADLPNRKRPARFPHVERGNRAVIVFLTVCTKHRSPLLAKPDIHALLIRLWEKPSQHWIVGRYVLLPDHVHLFCSPRSFESVNVREWSRYWKASATRAWPRKAERPIWQAEAWDTQLRFGDSYAEKWDYVRNNPVRHGLVDDAGEWPYKGEIERLEWHDY